MEMSNEQRYNGWANRDTWLVPLWIDNEQTTYLRKLEMLAELTEPCTESDAFSIAVMLWEGTDTIEWDNVRWIEIAEHFEAERLEEIRHNQ